MCKRLRLSGRSATSTSPGGGKFLSAFCVTLGLFLALFGLAGAPSAFATGGTSQVVQAHSLDQACPEGQVTCGAHFVITQIGDDAPATIEVVLSDKTTHTVDLQKISGKTAHYELKFTAGLTVTGATAVVPADWSGQFNLSHYLCKESETPPVVTPKNPTVTATAESCVKAGEYDGKITGSVTNTADDTKEAVTYTLKLLDVDGNVVDQTKLKDVADGLSVPYTLTGLTPSEYKVKVVGSDGTRASTTVTVEECTEMPPSAGEVTATVTRDCQGIHVQGKNETDAPAYYVVEISEKDASDSLFTQEGTFQPGETFSYDVKVDAAKQYVVAVVTGPSKDNLTDFPIDFVTLDAVKNCTVTPPPTNTTPPVTPPVVTPPVVTPPVVTPPVTTPPVVTPPSVTPPVVVPPATHTTRTTASTYPVAAHAGGSGVPPWQQPINMAVMGFSLLLIAFGLFHGRVRRAQGSSRQH